MEALGVPETQIGVPANLQMTGKRPLPGLSASSMSTIL